MRSYLYTHGAIEDALCLERSNRFLKLNWLSRMKSKVTTLEILNAEESTVDI